MPREPIGFKDLVMPTFAAWDDRWFLLTAGSLEPRDFNTMTVSWGAFGWLWHRPLAVVVVRPTRHTYGFMERFEDFTLSLFPEDYEAALLLCGQASGRDTDKVAEAELTPEPARAVRSPTFAEAELVLECRKAYFDDLEPRHFLDPRIHGEYHDDHHRVYFGEVVAVQGTGDWRR